MTWSILARDADSGLYGLAIASRFLAVGAVVPFPGGPHGAVMSQALPNPELGVRVDDHPDPLAELARLHEVAIPFSAAAFPRRERPHGVLDRAPIERIIARDAGKPLIPDIDIPGD